MDTEIFSTSSDLTKCGSCKSKTNMTKSSSGMLMRSVKRKYDDFVKGHTGLDLYEELEEERNASSTAANEAMSMISRLQKEKAEIQLDAHQFKRIAEEKMAHDQQVKLDLEDLLYDIEQSIQSITLEVQTYKHKMMCTDQLIEKGDKEELINNSPMIENSKVEYDLPPHSFPPLKCSSYEDRIPLEGDDEKYDSGDTPLKYAFGDTPRDHFKNLDALEKAIVGCSPRKMRQGTRFSNSTNLFISTGRGACPDIETPRLKTVVSQVEDMKTDNISENVKDDMEEKFNSLNYNEDKCNAIMHPTPVTKIYEAFFTTPRYSLNQPDMSINSEIKNLYVRILTLEADKESMKQAILAMRADEEHVKLLKEISQRLHNNNNINNNEGKMIKRRVPIVGNLSLMTVLKVLLSASCIQIFLVRRS
ncbi:hypothetical protein ACFE04_020896 [Oxalis oulophora]